MRTSKTQAIRSRLEATRRRFERWRRSRKIGARIPEALWAAGVELAEAYGIHATARALGVDYYSLKKWLEAKSVLGSKMAATGNGATFVELAPTAALNAPKMPRSHLQGNSNWAMNCLVSHCGVTVRWGENGAMGKPIGYDSPPCKRWEKQYVLIGAGPSYCGEKCVEWYKCP